MKKVLLVCCVAAAFIAQCGFSDRSAGPVSTQDGKGSFTCKVSMATAPANVAKLSGYLFKVRDSLNGIVDTVYFNFVVSGSYATAQVNNLAAGTWTTTVNAYNAQESLLYTGTSWIDVVPGQMSYVSIRLGPALGSVYFYVFWDTDTTWYDSTGNDTIPSDSISQDTVPVDTIQRWFSSFDTLKASESWHQTAFYCLPGDSLIIWANGIWKVDSNHTGIYGANGDTCHAVAGKAYVLPAYSKGALVGKIGANGMPFIIGAHFSSQVVDSGALYIVANEKLGSNGSFLKDNSGYLNVSSFIYR